MSLRAIFVSYGYPELVDPDKISSTVGMLRMHKITPEVVLSDTSTTSQSIAKKCAGFFETYVPVLPEETLEPDVPNDHQIAACSLRDLSKLEQETKQKMNNCGQTVLFIGSNLTTFANSAFYSLPWANEAKPFDALVLDFLAEQWSTIKKPFGIQLIKPPAL